MTAKWLEVRTAQGGRRLHLACHIDTSKVLPPEDGGGPDPDWVRRFEFGLDATMTAPRAIAEARALIAAEVAGMARTARPEEGTVFTP